MEDIRKDRRHTQGWDTYARMEEIRMDGRYMHAKMQSCSPELQEGNATNC